MRRRRWVALLVILVGAIGGLLFLLGRGLRGASEEAGYMPEQHVRFALSSPVEDERYIIVEARVPAGYRGEFAPTSARWRREEGEPAVLFNVMSNAIDSEVALADIGTCGPQGLAPKEYKHSEQEMLKVCSHDNGSYTIEKVVRHDRYWLSCDVTLSPRRDESADETWSARQRQDWLEVCRSFRILRGVPHPRNYQPNIPARIESPVFVDGVRKLAIVEVMLPATYLLENDPFHPELRALPLGRAGPPISFWSQWPKLFSDAAKPVEPGQAAVAEICRVPPPERDRGGTPERLEVTSHVVSYERTDDGGELAECSLRLDPKGSWWLAEQVGLDRFDPPHGEHEVAVRIRKWLPVRESRLVCEVHIPATVRFSGVDSSKALDASALSRWTAVQRADLLDVCRSFRLLEIREAQL